MGTKHSTVAGLVKLGESMCKMIDMNFYRGKRVFVTGHTGFKGSWLCKLLLKNGAIVRGYALEAPTIPSLYELLDLDSQMESVIGDIRNIVDLKKAMDEFRPEIVIHMAAQPIVRESYNNPAYTYETNVMGTVNVLECIRTTNYVKSFLNVTTDKVYENKEWEWGYRENDPLDGYDPYSNSKSCSELVTHSYQKSFFQDRDVAISTARAGNVIGGGDFAVDRIIPDCIRAVATGKSVIVRNPYSIRPFQHVLEPLCAYLMIAARQYRDKRYEGYYNVGPDECDCITTGELVDLFCNCWGENAKWENQTEENAPHESCFLKLDCSKIKKIFGWNPNWHIDKCVQMTCDFGKVWIAGGDVAAEVDREIDEFLGDIR